MAFPITNGRGLGVAALLMSPALVVSFGIAAFLWLYVGPDEVETPEDDDWRSNDIGPLDLTRVH